MTMEDEVRRFLDVALSRQHGWMVASGVPDRMRVGDVDPEGWVEWRPMPSELRWGDIADLEQDLDAPLPPPYAALLLDRHFIELACGVVYLDPHPAEFWRREFRQRLKLHDIDVARGLLPIGFEQGSDAGPIFFDLRKRGEDGDAPVVCHDLGWLGTDNEWRTFFSSGRRMFAALSIVLESPQGLDEQDTLRRFLAADPEGAGGAGWSWWTNNGRRLGSDRP